MPAVLSLPRLVAMLLLAGLLAACADVGEISDTREELGDFRLGHNVVVAANAQRAPISRAAEPEAWEKAIRDAVDERFSRYEGTRLYHVAVSVDGYLLAPPGVPLVASPRSALIIGVHLWDDELGRPLNEERRQLTVLEGVSGESLIGSGLTRSAEQQMTVLARNAARSIESWLAENSEWFHSGRPPRPEMLAALAELEADEIEDGSGEEGDRGDGGDEEDGEGTG